MEMDILRRAGKGDIEPGGKEAVNQILKIAAKAISKKA